MSNSPTKIELTQPDDWHLHIRDGEVMKDVLADTARQFARAIIMPNLKPPVTTVDLAKAYQSRIEANLKLLDVIEFKPLMTLYLTDNTSADEVRKAKDAGIAAFKLYPAGATTNSDAGVSDLKHCHAALEAMQAVGMPLLVHGEVTSAHIDIFDREAVFIDTVLEPFGGIGSVPFKALQMKRKAVMFELKKSYFDVACRNVKSAETAKAQLQLF